MKAQMLIDLGSLPIFHQEFQNVKITDFKLKFKILKTSNK